MFVEHKYLRMVIYVFMAFSLQISMLSWISMQGHSTMNVRGTLISTDGYSCFLDFSLQVPMLSLISIFGLAIDSPTRDRKVKTLVIKILWLRVL